MLKIKIEFLIFLINLKIYIKIFQIKCKKINKIKFNQIQNKIKFKEQINKINKKLMILFNNSIIIKFRKI